MPERATDMREPGAAVAEKAPEAAPEAPKNDAVADFASGMGNQQFSQLARSAEHEGGEAQHEEANAESDPGMANAAAAGGESKEAEHEEG